MNDDVAQNPCAHCAHYIQTTQICAHEGGWRSTAPESSCASWESRPVQVQVRVNERCATCARYSQAIGRCNLGYKKQFAGSLEQCDCWKLLGEDTTVAGPTTPDQVLASAQQVTAREVAERAYTTAYSAAGREALVKSRDAAQQDKRARRELESFNEFGWMTPGEGFLGGTGAEKETRVEQAPPEPVAKFEPRPRRVFDFSEED